MRRCLQPELCCRMQGFIPCYFCLAEAGGFSVGAGVWMGGTRGSGKSPGASQTRGFWPQQQSRLWVCPAPLSPCKDRLVALCPQVEGTYGAGRFLPQPPRCRQDRLQNLQDPERNANAGILGIAFKSCKVVTAEHETKPRSFLGAGHRFVKLAPGCRRATYFHQSHRASCMFFLGSEPFGVRKHFLPLQYKYIPRFPTM